MGLSPTGPHLPTAEACPGDAAAAWEWLQAQLAGRPVPAVLTIIGLGDLSILAALAARAPTTKVLALEADPARARATLAEGVVNEWRHTGRLVYLAGPDYAGADEAWRIFPTRFEQPPLLVHPDSAAVPDVRKAVTVLGKIVFGVKANAEARRKFAPRYLLNSLRNVPAMIAGGDVRALAGQASGVPAVLVAAGPSLNASLDELKRLQGRAVIIATDTALRPLLAHGINPPFVVALDPSEINGRHLVDLPAHPDTWLVAESALEPRATAAFHGRTLWFRVGPHQPWPWLNTVGIDIGRLEVWGSVLTAAYQVAVVAGCDPIVMVGADLSFPEGRPYARGTTYEYDWAWAAGFGMPVDETWRAQLAARKDIRIERDLTGAGTPTSAVMLEFRDWLAAQARKGGRRVVNATGRGLLMGDRIEQGRLLDVIAERQSSVPRFERQTPPFARLEVQLARAIDRVRDAIDRNELQEHPLPDWREFSGDGFDGAALRAALDSAAHALTAPGDDLPPASSRSAAPIDDLQRLPETITRLRAALNGDTSVSGGSVASCDSAAATLARALDLLQQIVQTVAGRADFAGYPDPDRMYDTPAGAIAMWPDDVRRAVLRFEGMLGRAWGRPSPPRRRAFAQGSVAPGDPDYTITCAARPYASHACVLLLIEWLQCAASLGPSFESSIAGAVERLHAVEAMLRTAQEWSRPKAAVHVVVQLRWNGASCSLVLPLTLSAEALWTLRAGLVHAPGGLDPTPAWLLGAADGDMTLRIVLRHAGAGAALEPAPFVGSVIPRPLEWPESPVVKTAGQVGDRALCIAPGARRTLLVDAAGRFTAYQEWPRALTGALSLGAHGEVAWSGALSVGPNGLQPYVMYRAAAGAEVTTVSLPFRPAQGVWYNGHVFWNCLPTATNPGGVGSWAPGGTPVWHWPHLALQGLVVSGCELCLEPYIAGADGGIGRRRTAGFGAWVWAPGTPPRQRTLGPLGAASSSASNGRWTAVSYPQADLITLRSADGRAHYTVQCYFPTRLAWAGESLVVFAADRELLLFERLVALVEAER